MKSSEKGFIAPLLIIIFALVIAGGGSYFLIKNNQSKSNQNNLLNVGTDLPNVPIVVQKNLQNIDSQNFDKTKDWKVYKNNQYEFELKYPSDWEIKDVNRDGVAISIIPPDQQDPQVVSKMPRDSICRFVISVTSQQSDISFDDFSSGRIQEMKSQAEKDSFVLETKKITISKKPAYVASMKSSETTTKLTWLASRGYIYNIGIVNCNKYIDITDDITNSFSLLKT